MSQMTMSMVRIVFLPMCLMRSWGVTPETHSAIFREPSMKRAQDSLEALSTTSAPGS